MTENEYICKGVERADGFLISQTRKVIRVADIGSFLMTNLPVTIKDALAAQLVRQVDSLKDYSVETNHSCTRVVHHKPLSDSFTRQVVSPDRTMNTIRAIVDSGVLSE